MGKRAHSEFKSLDGYTFKIEIHDPNFSGTSHEFKVAADGLVLSYEGNTNDIHEPVLGSLLTLTVVASTSDDDTLLDDIRTGGEAGHRILVTRNFTPGGATQYTYWNGVVLDEMRVVDVSPQTVELNWTDDLALLDEVLYKPDAQTEYNDQQNVPVMLTRCLSKLRWWSDVYSTGDTVLKIAEYVTHDDVGGSPAINYIIANHNKLRNPDDDGNFQYHTCGEILRMCLVMMQSRIQHENGVFWVRGLGTYNQNSQLFSNYTTTGVLDTTPTLTSNIEFTTATNYQTNLVGAVAPFDILTGFEFGKLPAASEISMKVKTGGPLYDWVGGYNVNTGTSWSDVNSYGNTTTVEIGEVQTVVFSYFYNIDGSGAAGNGARAKLSFGLRHGSRYAKRDGDILLNSDGTVTSSTWTVAGANVDCFSVVDNASDWSNTTTDTIDVWLPVYQKHLGVEYQSGMATVTFPPLDVSTGTTQIQGPTLTLYNEDGTTYTADVEVSLSGVYGINGAGVVEGDSILYRRINGDATARERIKVDPLILTDRLSEFTPATAMNWAINPGGAFIPSTTDWGNVKLSTSQPIASLVCWDRLAMRLEPVETITGTLRHPNLGPTKTLSFTHGKYIPTSLSFNADAGFWDVEAVLYAYDNGTEPTSETTTPNLTGDIILGAGRSAALVQSDFFNLSQTVQNALAESRSVQQAFYTAPLVNETRLAQVDLDSLADVVIVTPQSAHVVKYDGSQFRNAFLTLNELGNVVLTNPANGEVLQYNGTNWVNATSSGGASSFADLDDVNPNLSPAPGHLLIWTTTNGGQWSSTTPQLAIGSAIDAGDLGNVTETASGTAGHILLDYALGGSAYWISTALDTATKSHVDLADIKNVSTATPTTGDLLRFNGTSWEPAAAFSYATIQSSFFTSDGNGDYIPLGGTLTETTSPQYYNRYTAPLDGEIVEARIFVTTTTAGSCQLRFAKYPVPQWVATATATISSGNSPVQFSFGGNATFSAGDQLQLWFDPTGSPGGVSVSILLKFEHP
jgi:hypothetical protein